MKTDGVAFGVDEVALPCHAGEGEFWEGDGGAGGESLGERFVVVVDDEGAAESVETLGWGWSWARATDDAAVDTTGFFTVASFYHPVFHLASFPFGDFPTEDVGVELRSTFWVIRMNFEMSDAIWHRKKSFGNSMK